MADSTNRARLQKKKKIYSRVYEVLLSGASNGIVW